jgi:RimJ/RimL family protein N-acetyltransferase
VEITTDRLVLRPITSGDAPLLAAVYTDPEVARFLTPLDEIGTARQVEGFVDEWQERGFGILAVLDRDTGEFMGRSGLRCWPQFGEVEVGWVIRRDAWGRGLAIEAGQASLRWGFETLALAEITAIVHKKNVASMAVAERLGMEPLRDDQLFGLPVTVFAKRP